MDAPLLSGDEIPITEEEEEFMVNKYELYGKVVGMLGALMLSTRPDLAYSVGQLRQYLTFPRRHHFQALKRVVRYLKATVDFGMVYDRRAKRTIVGYVDSDHAANTDDRVSVSGYVFLFAGAAFAWKSKRQRGTICGRLREHETEEQREERKTSDASRSTAESELRALDLGTREALWIRKLAKAFRMPEGDSPLPIREDNQACYFIAKNNKWTSGTKHVATMYFAVRDDIIDKRIDLIPVASKDNFADIFTKPLKPHDFEKFRLAIGVRSASV